DVVRRLEADAAGLARESVGLFANDAGAAVAELLVDTHRERGRDAERVERCHDLANLPLLGPGARDPTRPDLADAVDLFQPVGARVDDVERLLAERLDDPRGVRRADSLDHAAAEVALHALERRRQLGAVVHNG